MVFWPQMTEMLDSTRFLIPDDRKWRQYLVFNGFVDFWSQGRNTSNRVFWSPFCRLLEPRPENAQIDPSGVHFSDFWSQGLEMLKSTFLELILSTSGAKAWKCSNRSFWSSFCRLLEAWPENAQIKPFVQRAIGYRVFYVTFVQGAIGYRVCPQITTLLIMRR